MTVKLAHEVLGSGPPLIIIHGLFGSKTNWRTLSRRFAERHTVYLVDQRNHGESPWDDDMSYTAMAADLDAFLDEQRLSSAYIMGHSMGGKAAMTLALNHPDRVESLVVVDIAPVRYAHDLSDYIEAMRKVDLGQAKRRADVDHQLQSAVPEAGIRGFLIQNLRQDPDTGLSWRVNLDALHREMSTITAFPHFNDAFGQPTLFLYGGRSHYVRDDYRQEMDRLFPHAEYICVQGAGHWLHAEQPDRVFEHISEFLNP